MNDQRTSLSSVDDEDDVEDRYNPEWKAEQVTRLLPFDDIQEDLVDKIYVPVEYGGPQRPLHFSQLKVIARNTAAVSIAILFCVLLLVATTKRVESGITFQDETTVQPTSFRRSPSEYILSPHWDFTARPRIRRYHWTVSDEVVNPDGVYRQMMLINGQFPGPLIECNEGDTLEVEVENQSTNATSFHWHGIYQNGTNWMDGTVGVTQCPIAPGGNFTYRFTIQRQSGTYWSAAHTVHLLWN